MNEQIRYRAGRLSSAATSEPILTPPPLSRGLTDASVAASRRQYGSNALTPRKPTGFFRRFLSNLNDPIIKILIAALVVNLILSFVDTNTDASMAESAGIALTVLISALVTTLSEHSSGAAFEKLYSSLSDAPCRVLRNGEEGSIPLHDIVQYDLVCLYPGDTVPADGVLVAGSVTCDEAALTGESRAVLKTSARRGDYTMESGNPSTVLRGSHIVSGNGLLLVLAVGDATLYGSIATELATEESVSPLKNRLAALARTISKIGYVSAAVVAAVHLADAFWFDAGLSPAIALTRLRDLRFVVRETISALTLGLSIVVVAVPEGLPMMITVVLSSNMKRMLSSGVLVRRLVGIETAGNMDILFTDKTGTLTTGQLCVTEILNATGNAVSPFLRSLLTSGARACAGANNATESAIAAYHQLHTHAGDGNVPAIPFDSARKFAAALVGDTLHVRGAAEYLLPCCTAYRADDGQIHPMTREMRAALDGILRARAAASCRLLVHAECAPSALPHLRTHAPDASTPLTFVGLYVLRDALRAGVPEAVAECHAAGITVVMLTGDHAATAAGIAQSCGILPASYRAVTDGAALSARPSDDRPLLLDGAVLRTLDDDTVTALLPQIRVIARVTPTDKSRLVRLAKAAGHIVGMTGDGVNDAPALRSADVGFAMGSGTDIAREAGDIVITDDHFVSITKAVLYGRTIFSSIRKFITFQLTMNLAAVGVSVLGTVFGIEHPVTVIQMLWVNLIMDTLGSLAFAGEPALAEYMRRPPVSRAEHILTPAMTRQIVLTGGYAVALSMFFLLSPRVRHFFGGNDAAYMTQFFALFIFMGIAIALCTRTPRINLLAHIRKNRAFLVIIPAVAAVQLLIIYFGGEVFRCVPLPADSLLRCAILSSTVIPWDTIRKAIRGMRGTI